MRLGGSNNCVVAKQHEWKRKPGTGSHCMDLECKDPVKPPRLTLLFARMYYRFLQIDAISLNDITGTEKK